MFVQLTNWKQRNHLTVFGSNIMDNVLETIEQIQKRLEREVEWPLTDNTNDVGRVRKHIREINTQLNFLKRMIEVENEE